MEKVLWLMEHVKSGLWGFLLELSHWVTLHVWIDPLKLIAIKSTLIENNQCYTMQEIADIFKIPKSNVENHLHQFGYVNCFDVWIPHKLREKTLFDHVSACDSLLKCNKSIPFLKQIVMGYEKWILYKKMWNRRDHGASEMNHHWPHQKLVFTHRRWCFVYGGIGRESSIYELLPEN